MAIIGSKRLFENCANFIISIGLILIIEINTPINRTKDQTSLNLLLLSESFQPKQLLATYAAAKGAVIEEVIPEANKPTPKK
jgi:hypothetical protein